MSHNSRVCAILFDVDSSSCEEAAKFWAGALGRTLSFDPKEKYTSLEGEIDYLIQNAEPGFEGVHIDVETDEVDAEVARLERLGARKREKVKNWWGTFSRSVYKDTVVLTQR